MNKNKTQIDVKQNLIDLMTFELSQEIDREIMNRIREALPANPRNCYE